MLCKKEAGEKAKALKKVARDLAKEAKAQKEAAETIERPGYSFESSVFGCLAHDYAG